MCIDHEKIERINDANLAQLYHVTYRDEIMVTVRANNEQEARDKAKDSTNWEFVADWHEDFVMVEQANSM